MRLKNYSAASANEALKLVRDELGERAVIVSTETDRGAGMTTVTAALDDRADIEEAADQILAGISEGSATLRQALNRHGTPPHLGARMVTAMGRHAAGDPLGALEAGLRAIYRFEPLTDAPDAPPIMIVGPPGVGKTVTVAKMAARNVLNGGRPTVMTMDTVRAGAIGQLEAFTRILDIDLTTVRTLDDLQSAALSRDPAQPAFIDTAGVNPFSDEALDSLAFAAKSIDAEPVLVVAAGGDPVEASEIAAAFAKIGCRRMLVTRIDLTRRLGGVLAAANSGRLAFSEISIKPDIADGLDSVDPARLAALLATTLTDLETMSTRDSDE